MHEILLKDWMC